MKSLKFILLLLSFGVIINFNTSEAQWEQIGPFGANYRISSSAGNNLFLGLYEDNNYYSKIIMSTTEGLNWNVVGSWYDLGTTYIKTFDNYIFRGTYDAILYRSSNDGIHWEGVWNGLPPTSAPINTLENNNNVLYCGVDASGIYKSTNFGNTWIDVNNDITIYSGIIGFAFSGEYVFAINFYKEIFRSDSSGNSWITVFDNPTVSFNNIINNGSYLFVSTDFHGIIRSSNNGISWEYANSGLTNLSVSSVKSSGSNLFASTMGGGVFISTDNGENWTEVNNGLYRLKVSDLIITNNAIFAGMGLGGIYYSTNNGSQWNNLNAKFYSYDAYGDIISNNQFIFANFNSGILRSSDNGDSWEFFDNNLPAGSNAFAVKDNFIFNGYSQIGVYRSSDNGSNWQSCATGLDIPSLKVMTSNSQYLFSGAGNGMIYRTSNYGLNWTSINTGMQINNMRKMISFDSKLYIGANSGLYFSSNNGYNWSNAGLNYFISDITCNGQYIFAVARDSVYRSSNNGANWTVVYSKDSIEGANLTAIVSSGNNIITGGFNNFSYSANNGENWTLVNNEGISSENIYNVSNLSVSGGYFYARMGNPESYWRRPLTEIINAISNDVGVTVIIEPFPGEVRNLYCDNITFNPKSSVLNFGTNAQPNLFNVNYEISFYGSVVYLDTKQITLELNQSKTVNFTPYSIPYDQPGIYKVRSWSSLSSDSNYSNDTSYSEFRANPNPNYGYSDISNYYFLNSSANADCIPEQPVFNWEDTTGSVTLISGGNVIVPFTDYNSFYFSGCFRLPDVLPNGNKFRFFGTCYDTIVIATNGIIGLGGSVSGMNIPFPVSIPSVSAPKPAIFPFWIWCNFFDPEIVGRNLKYKVTSDKFIVTYDKVPIYNTQINAYDYVSYQVILELKQDCSTQNSKIKVQFDNSRSGSTFLNNYYNGSLKQNTIGIQNSAGNIALQYRYTDPNGNLITPGPLFGSPLAIEFAQINELLPIELVSFNSIVTENNVSLSWQTSSELNNSGFDIERSGLDNKW
ncbi:MAG TPA: hypothetical protein PKA90_16485, partial [Ignavibacteria bacterium]|nr:hypothetical protein [Ignavibacteria bacterium]HMR42016.1 hypothetical protein [Ignavibacteria bacterium]